MHQGKSNSYSCNLRITKTGIAQNESVVHGTRKYLISCNPTLIYSPLPCTTTYLLKNLTALCDIHWNLSLQQGL